MIKNQATGAYHHHHHHQGVQTYEKAFKQYSGFLWYLGMIPKHMNDVIQVIFPYLSMIKYP